MLGWAGEGVGRYVREEEWTGKGVGRCVRREGVGRSVREGERWTEEGEGWTG